MKSIFFPAIRITVVCMIFFCGIYSMTIWAVAQFATNNGKADIIRQGNKIFYKNVGQRFTDDSYFYSRPSAVNYDAAGAAGSNKGPSNPDYLQTVKERIDTFLLHNPGIERSEIPSDLVTASGSGLDPHISPAAARIQVKRIAKIRGIAEASLRQLVLNNIEQPLSGFLGTERINVLKLNIALDQLNKDR
jgi:potassium-transporting ATPase KdpC subunit